MGEAHASFGTPFSLSPLRMVKGSYSNEKTIAESSSQRVDVAASIKRLLDFYSRKCMSPRTYKVPGAVPVTPVLIHCQGREPFGSSHLAILISPTGPQKIV